MLFPFSPFFLFFVPLFFLFHFSFSLLSSEQPSTPQIVQSEDFLLIAVSRSLTLLTDFHLQLGAMDSLFTDQSGRVPTIEFRVVGDSSWMALNAPASTIPAEAMDYRTKKADDQRPMGPTGVFLEMEWGLDMDWYDHDASWQLFIPLKSDDPGEGALSESGSDWFFDFEMSTPWVQGIGGGFTIPERTRSTIDSDLTNWSSVIDEIATNHPFPHNSSRPPSYDRGIINWGFSDCAELQAAGCIAKRMAIDYLGFIAWWTSSISRWEADLDPQVTDQIRGLHLGQFRK